MTVTFVFVPLILAYHGNAQSMKAGSEKYLDLELAVLSGDSSVVEREAEFYWMSFGIGGGSGGGAGGFAIFYQNEVHLVCAHLVGTGEFDGHLPSPSEGVGDFGVTYGRILVPLQLNLYTIKAVQCSFQLIVTTSM